MTLGLSLNGFKRGEQAIAIGYAEMNHIPIEIRDGVPVVPEFQQDLYVSVGSVSEVYPENHLRKEVPTPGPCFAFQAKVPGFHSAYRRIIDLLGRWRLGRDNRSGNQENPAAHEDLHPCRPGNQKSPTEATN